MTKASRAERVLTYDGAPNESSPQRRGHRMRRRSVVIAGLGALLIAPERSAGEQLRSKIPRVGILTPADNDRTPIFEAFKQGLHELGYIEGHNIVLEFRSDHGDVSILPQLAAELVALPVDIIVTDSADAAVAAGTATRRIPLVMAAGPDPVSLGLAASLSRPGGNLTGFDLMGTGTGLDAKQLDLLHTAFPNMTPVAVLLNPSNTRSTTYLRAIEEAARSMGLRIVTRVEPGTPEALRALTPSAFTGAAGVTVIADAMFWNHRQAIIALVNAARLPAIYFSREFADDGGLMAYGPNVPDNFRRAAGYVDRILRGAKPGDLPIQEPTKFELVINLRTAKALGLTIPRLLLAQADEVIE
jgi:putative tryptophan/tyrosine transport system substrate-binding protein